VALLLVFLPALIVAPHPSVMVYEDNDYSNLHNVVGGSDLSMFRKIGTGECLAPASRPVRGRARRDLTHLWCRRLCVGSCLGYTYAPCERVCTLHGDPTQLQNTSDADGWQTVNGGGMIETCSQRCGSTCYQRMSPSPPGQVVSNTAVLDTPAMPFGSVADVSCPLPYVGTVKVRAGLQGPFIEAGRCRSPCAAGIVVNGNFDVHYPDFLHGSSVQAVCPSGATGVIVLSCSDGKATWESGRCGYDCVLGSLIVGDAVISYPALNHTGYLNMTCPNITSGNVTLQCWDSTVTAIEGTCNLNCDAGDMILRYGDTLGEISFGAFNHSDENETECEPDTNFTGMITLRCNRGTVSIVDGHCYRHCLPSTIGPGVKALPYPRFDHESKLTMQCLPGFTGELELECVDGNATLLKGECMMHCLAGAVTTNSINLPHPLFNHSTSLNLTCPWPSHSGYVIASCFDGAVSYTGMCGNNCLASSYWSNGYYAAWDFIQHGYTADVPCPVPAVGSVAIRCFDGSARYISGKCGRPCKDGAVSKNGAIVYYPALNHTDVQAYPCASLFSTGLSFSGSITVECVDGFAQATGSCEADCPNGKLTADGAQVFYPSMPHGEETTAVCSPGTPEAPLYGTIQVVCKSGYASAVSGTCGGPCEEGEFTSQETRDDFVTHPTIAHTDSKWVICPPHLSGFVHLFCRNGVVEVIGNGTCGDRCQPEYLEVYGASLTTPLMEHRAKVDYPCEHPFNGVVKLSCDFGQLFANSECQAECLPGNVSMEYGAALAHPKMMSGDLYPTRCPLGFVDVPVVLRCQDGKGVVHSGGCFKHCAADWFYDPHYPREESWAVQHYEILHDSATIRECPEYFDGKVTLSCWNGKATMTSGHCSRNCRPNRIMIRAGVVVMNREMLSGQLAASVPCPPSFDGSMRLLCTEGVVSLGEGGCNATCPPGIVLTAPYGELGDNEVAEIACPDTGTVFIRCNDGTVTVLGGRCFKGCESGTVIDKNGTRIEYPYIRHNESTAGACAGLSKGVVTLQCNDTKVIQAALPGERCLRFCRSQPVETPDGSTIFPPDTEHGNQATVRCPNGQLGLVTVSCYDTEFQVIDGVCGNTNCPESYVYSNGALLTHYAINNGWRAGPTMCPAPYQGVSTFWCRNGTTVVDEVTVQLPVSDEDFEAVALGNETSEDSRFLLCGCCYPHGAPPAAEAIKGRETGIYISVVASGAGLSVMLAVVAGWYFLPRKKTSRVWPEKKKPPDPRPVAEQTFDMILDQFQMKLKNNPELIQSVLEKNLKLKALPPADQKLAIENIKQNPNEAKKFLSRRSMHYLLAVEDVASNPTPASPKISSRAPISPKSASARSGGRIAQLPPQLALGNGEQEALADVPDNNLRSPSLAWPEVSPISTGQALLLQAVT